MGANFAPPKFELRQRSAVGQGVLTVALGFLCVFLGTLIAVFPGRVSVAFALGICGMVCFVALLLSRADYKVFARAAFWMGLFYVFAVVLWPRYGSLPFNFLPIRNPRRALFVLTLAVALSGIVLSKDIRNSVISTVSRAPQAFVFLAAFLFWRSVSLFSSNDVVASLLALSVEFMGVFSAIIIWSAAIQDKRQLKRVLLAIGIAAGLAAALVVLEGLWRKNLYLTVLSIDPGESAYFSFLFDRVRDGAYRAQGAFEHPLLLGEFIVFTLPVVVSLGVTSRKITGKLIWSLIFLALLVATYFVRSRAAVLFVGLMGAFGIALVISRLLLKSNSQIKWLAPIALAVVVLFAGFFVAPIVSDMIFGVTVTEQGSTSTRLLMITRGVPIIVDNPLFGIGPGAAPVAIGIYGSQGLPISDNYYLQVAMESGIPALLFFVGFWALIVASAIRSVLTMKKGESQSLAVGLLIGVVGILLFKFVMAEVQNFEFLFMGLVGLLLLTDSSNRESGTPFGHRTVGSNAKRG